MLASLHLKFTYDKKQPALKVKETIKLCETKNKFKVYSLIQKGYKTISINWT